MKKPAAKGKDDIKISNPQFHKGCNAWTLKSGSKQVIAVPCLCLFFQRVTSICCVFDWGC